MVAIEDQMDMGEEGLVEEDRNLLYINLEILNTILREIHLYWLLAIQAILVAKKLHREKEQHTGKTAGR
jgi:hypothetical protein